MLLETVSPECFPVNICKALEQNKRETVALEQMKREAQPLGKQPLKRHGPVPVTKFEC